MVPHRTVCRLDIKLDACEVVVKHAERREIVPQDIFGDRGQPIENLADVEHIEQRRQQAIDRFEPSQELELFVRRLRAVEKFDDAPCELIDSR
jgi:hypothetical protein